MIKSQLQNISYYLFQKKKAGKYCFVNSQLYFDIIKFLNPSSLLITKRPMRKFEVRFADTGYPRKFENMTIEMLQQQIYKQFKIDRANQKILSKRGVIITGQERLDNENSLKKTFSGDVNNPHVMSEYMGMYLFNHKQLLKNQTEDRSNTIQFDSQVVLNKMRETTMALRTHVYELQPFEKKFTSEEMIKITAANPIIRQVATSWHEMCSNLINIVETYKDNGGCFDQYIERWENQRKALYVLGKNLQILTNEKKASIQKLIEYFNSTKTNFEKQHSKGSMQMSLSNSLSKKPIQSYLTQVTKTTQSILTTQKKLQALHNHLSQISKKCGQFRKNIKQCHFEPQKQIKQYDQTKRKQLKQLEQFSDEMKLSYSELIQGIKDIAEKGIDMKLGFLLSDRKKMEDRFQKYRGIGLQFNCQLQGRFVDMYRLYLQHVAMVKSEYKIYNDLYVDMQQNWKQNFQKIQNETMTLNKSILQLTEEKNQLDLLLNPNPLSQSLSHPMPIPIPITQYEQSQYKRRYLFNTKLQCLQQQIKQILKQEENSRRKYVEEMLAIDQKYENQVLGNVRVPCFLANFDQTSDREVVGRGKSGTRGRDRQRDRDRENREGENGFAQIDVEMYRECMGMDRILRELQIVKNCQISLKSQIPIDTKTKNLQTLLQKSSQIFHRIYTHKQSLLTKQHAQVLQSHIARITTLQSQNKQLHHRIYTFTQNISSDMENKKELEYCVDGLRKELADAEQRCREVQRKFGVELGEIEGKVRSYEGSIQGYKKDILVLKQQKKDLQDKLTNLVSNTQTIFTQLQISANTIKQLQQMNHQYKIVMGDQAIKIATLQTQLQILREQGNEGQPPFPTNINTINNTNQLKLQQSFYGNLPQPLSHSLLQPQPLQLLQSQSQTQSLPQPQQTQQLKQIQREIGKLEKQIEELKEENQELKRVNDELNQEIMDIAMKDTEDVQVQVDIVEKQKEREIEMERGLDRSLVSFAGYARIAGIPQTGQTRIFIPFTTGIYICLKSPKPTSSLQPQYPPIPYLTSQTRNYLHIHQTELTQTQQQNWPYILDMNCLSPKSRELLTECTLIVVLKIGKILPANDKWYVQGDIVAAMGFEDQDLGVKDYGEFIR